MPFVNDKGEQVDFPPDDSPDAVSDKDAADRAAFCTIEAIAELGWEAHRAWESIIGEGPKLAWEQMSDDRRAALCDGVKYILKHPAASTSAQHDYWRARRASTVGDDFHPNMVPFDQLPWAQQMKARLWRNIVHAIVG
jgi:hypothetical protein